MIRDLTQLITANPCIDRDDSICELCGSEVVERGDDEFLGLCDVCQDNITQETINEDDDSILWWLNDHR